MYKAVYSATEWPVVIEPSSLISVAALQEQLGSDDLRILDCRFDLQDPQAGRRAYACAHIPGAVYADLDQDLAAPIRTGTGRHPLPDAQELARVFGAMGIAAQSRVVVYDDSTGALAARAWWLLRWLGHEHVALLDGGWARWQAMAAPVEAEAKSATAQRFTATPKDNLVLETGEILDQIEAGKTFRLVDARDEQRFRGLIEPIDSVAGHIPGAVNLPFTESLAPDGTWKSPEELRVLLRDVLEGDLEAPWSVMCGSGVTACHLAIAARLAGLREPRLYVGSWSEWITDPSRPVAADGG